MDGGGRKLRAIAKKQQASKSVGNRRLDNGAELSPLRLHARRFFHRAEARVETLPPFFASLASLGLVGGFAFYGMVLGGQAASLASTVTTIAGFEVHAVSISGHDYMREQDILDVLELRSGVSLVTFNVAAAHEMLLRQPWIAQASVRKIYPGKLQITLKEREPFAIWQRGQVVSIVDRDGQVLDDFNEERYGGLPVLVGYGAGERGAEFLRLLSEFPLLKNKVRASMLRSQRRWDILLDNAVTVKLPETGIRETLARLLALDNEKGVLSKDIVSVDMRLSDRLVVRLSEDAMVTRRAVLKRRKESEAWESKI